MDRDIMIEKKNKIPFDHSTPNGVNTFVIDVTDRYYIFVFLLIALRTIQLLHTPPNRNDNHEKKSKYIKVGT